MSRVRIEEACSLVSLHKPDEANSSFRRVEGYLGRHVVQRCGGKLCLCKDDRDKNKGCVIGIKGIV